MLKQIKLVIKGIYGPTPPPTISQALKFIIEIEHDNCA